MKAAPEQAAFMVRAKGTRDLLSIGTGRTGLPDCTDGRRPGW